MSSFLKIILQNLIKGPSTEKYPFGDTFEPAGLRGKLRFNAEACIACGTCEHVCAGGAIRITEAEDCSGLNMVIWHNSCCYCGLCQFFCPTKAIRHTIDYHTAHKQEDKFNYAERGFIKTVPCSRCGKQIVPAAQELLEQAGNSSDEIKDLLSMCEKCRQKETVIRGALRNV
ncbi:MAG: 4Fe-4S binding protein [Peptococcaceae bacterium]|nr:4Fe-4S binding protein [Peptococcaceae bacterium]